MLLLASILLSSYSFALVQVDGPTRSVYNVGDKFPLSGYIVEDSDVSGFLKIAVKCGPQEFPLQLVPASLKSGTQKTFQELGVPQITISSAMNGQCLVSLSLVSGNKTYSSGESKLFEATKALEGSFMAEEPRVQTGQPLEITGTILKMDGSGANGIAEIYFTQNDQKFLIDNTPFNDGLFNYTYQTRAITPGAYSIDIIARDNFGNEMAFSNAATFFLSNKLEVRVRADKAVALPGETVKLTGEVKTVLNKAPEGASLELVLDAIRMPVALKDGSFETELKLPGNIKSGKHDITVNAVDNSGNSGSDGAKIEITPVATTLTVITDKQNYLPKDNLGLTANLYDQGSDQINTFVNLDITDPKGEKRSTTEIQTNKLEMFRVPEFAAPGQWKLKASIKTLSNEASFSLLEVKKLDAKVSGETLYLRNIGNVKHAGKITILMDKGREQFPVIYRKSLMPNETVALQLNNYAPNGEYTVTLQLPKETTIANEEPLSVKIENGKKLLNLNAFFAVLVAALVFVLLYMSLLKPSPRHKFERKTRYEPDFKMPGDRPRRRAESVQREEKPKDDLSDFRERILRDIRKTEENASKTFRNKRGGLGPGSNSGGSAFANMFG